MKLRAELLRTVLIQGLGAAALLLAVIYLGAMLGPEAQGRFNRTKAEVEFVAALAMLGLPQAMFYFVQRAELPLRRALRIAALAALGGAVCAAGYALLALPAPGARASAAAQQTLLLALALATAGCVWHGGLRALLLTLQSSAAFNAITAAPQILLLVVALAWVGFDADVGDALVAAGLAIAYLAPAAWAQRVLWRQPVVAAPAATDASSVAPKARALVGFGAAAWLAASLATAAVLIVQRSVEQTLGAAALGVFTMAFVLAQVPLMPISYAAPLLFRHWMRTDSAAPPMRALLLPVASICAIALLALAGWAAGIGFGQRYAALGLLLPLLLAGSAGESVLRLLGAHANAAGRPWHVVAAEALRCIGLAIGAVLGAFQAGLLASGAVWVGSAWAAALLMVLLGRLDKARKPA